MMAGLKSKVKRLLRTLATKRAYKVWLKDWSGLGDLKATAHVLQTMRSSRNLEPMVIDPTSARRVLVIAPHPDDEAIGAGGSLILNSRSSGGKCRIVFLTAGRASERPVREQEAKRSCNWLKAEYVMLEHDAGELPLDKHLMGQLADHINEFRPDRILLPLFFDDNDDHRRVSHLLFMADKERLIHSNPEVWAYQVYSAVPVNVIVDITDVADEKSALISIHKSEMAKRDWAHFSLGQNAYISRFLPQGGSGRYAEFYFAAPLQEYIVLCREYFNNPSKCYYNKRYI